MSEITSVRIDIGSKLPSSGLTHCEENVVPESVIVPPTRNKTEYHKGLSKVWGRAASELREAEYICVAGYSLPESDYFLRYLFALGAWGRKRIKRFLVVDTSKTVLDRFYNLLSSDAQKKFNPIPYQFERTIDLIKKEIVS